MYLCIFILEKKNFNDFPSFKRSFFVQENKEIMLEDMTATIDIKGTDVLNGLKFLTENSDIILEPLPSWATKGKKTSFT